MTALQYRSNFFIEAAMSVFWLAWTVVPLLFVFEHRTSVAGWTWEEALVVMGFFVTLQGLLDALIAPNLRAVVEHVRKGTLDFVLLKPADAQLLVSLARTVPAKIVHVLGGLGLVTWAASRLPVPPGPGDVLLAGLLLLAGAAALYGMWLAVVSTSFWFVRIDNLSHLIEAIIDAGRWPLAVYHPVVRFVFTFLVPVGLMTTYPALALRGAIAPEGVAVAVGVGAGALFASRRVWRFALSHYASASS
jgi:ABC-2 type transport system permease protein